MFTKNKMVLALAILGMTGAVHAADPNVAGNVSRAGALSVGAADYGTLKAPGAKVTGAASDKTTSFDHYALAPFKNSVNGLYKFSGKQLQSFGAPASHATLGVWSFAQAGTSDVWFGEWDAEGTTVGSKVDGTHTAFYVGDSKDVATTLPTSGNVTYSVKSVNRGNTATAALPSSTLTANFSTKVASSTGDISFTGGTISTSGTEVKLAASSVGVASVSGTGGTLQGNFYGTGASTVAGLVTFTDRNKDTAFGGTKN